MIQLLVGSYRMRVKQKYINVLTRYLRWVADDFLRPKFSYDPNGMSAAEAMLRWETHGEALPESTSEPDLLAKYVQGKTSRDFYIENWREDWKQGQACPEEFLYTLGFDEQEFRSVFGREPDAYALFNLGMRDEFLRFTEGKELTFPLDFIRVALLRSKSNDEK